LEKNVNNNSPKSPALLQRRPNASHGKNASLVAVFIADNGATLTMPGK
jgi:hypothetical protein